MSSFTHRFTGICLVAMVAVSTLAVPTPKEVEPAQLNVTIDTSKIKPEIVQHGPLDDKALEALIANLTSGGDKDKTEVAKTKKLPTRQATEPTAKKSALLSYTGGVSDPKNCKPFLVGGPILGLGTTRGSNDILNLKLTSATGNTTELAGLAKNSTPPPDMEFGVDELVTNFTVVESKGKVVAVYMNTSGQKAFQFFFEDDGKTTVPDSPILPKVTNVAVGSGIIAQVRGEVCDGQFMNYFGIDFIDELASLEISDISYSGFVKNLFPAGQGTVHQVGSQILDNRNSSVQNQMTLTTASAVTQGTQINVATNWKVGGSVAVTAGATVPFIGKTDTTVTASFELGGSTDKMEMQSQTTTNTAAFPLNCPAKKYCIATASFTMFKIDVDIKATLKATTKSGDVFTWQQSGTYKGEDSLAMQSKIDESE